MGLAHGYFGGWITPLSVILSSRHATSGQSANGTLPVGCFLGAASPVFISIVTISVPPLSPSSKMWWSARNSSSNSFSWSGRSGFSTYFSSLHCFSSLSSVSPPFLLWLSVVTVSVLKVVTSWWSRTVVPISSPASRCLVIPVVFVRYTWLVLSRPE